MIGGFPGLFLPLRWLFQTHPIALNPEAGITITTSNIPSSSSLSSSSSSSKDTRRFIQDFESSFGSQHPSFHENGYQSAVSLAHRNSKFLLIYLHSPMHVTSTILIIIIILIA